MRLSHIKLPQREITMCRIPFLTIAAIVAALLAASPSRADEPAEHTVTVLFNEATVEIEKALVDGEQLWVTADDVSQINGFDPKPEGFCAADVCIPIPKSAEWRIQHYGREYFNVSRFAAKVDQAVAADAAQGTWSFGMVPVSGSSPLPSGVAPDFELPDREGNLVKLSDFRGKKVLILTWASW